MRRPSAAWLLVAGLILASCTEEGSPSSSSPDVVGLTSEEAQNPISEAAGRFSMTRSMCRYVGPESVAAGSVTLLVASETASAVDFDLWMIDEGHAYEELVAHIDEEHRRSEQGLPGLGHPTFARLIAETRADAGQEATLATSLEPGVYAMACIPLDAEGAPRAIVAAGPFTAE